MTNALNYRQPKLSFFGVSRNVELTKEVLLRSSMYQYIINVDFTNYVDYVGYKDLRP